MGTQWTEDKARQAGVEVAQAIIASPYARAENEARNARDTLAWLLANQPMTSAERARTIAYYTAMVETLAASSHK